MGLRVSNLDMNSGNMQDAGVTVRIVLLDGRFFHHGVHEEPRWTTEKYERRAAYCDRLKLESCLRRSGRTYVQHKKLRDASWFFVNSVVKKRTVPQKRALS